jgi:hypothetical protein
MVFHVMKGTNLGAFDADGKHTWWHLISVGNLVLEHSMELKDLALKNPNGQPCLALADFLKRGGTNGWGAIKTLEDCLVLVSGIAIAGIDCGAIAGNFSEIERPGQMYQRQPPQN